MKNDVACTTTVNDMQEKFKYCSRYERGYNSPEPLADESIHPIVQVVNTSSSKTSTNGVPPQDSNNANKNKEHEMFYPISLKLKEKYVSIATIYNEWFGLGTSKIILPCGIYSL